MPRWPPALWTASILEQGLHPAFPVEATKPHNMHIRPGGSHLEVAAGQQGDHLLVSPSKALAPELGRCDLGQGALVRLQHVVGHAAACAWGVNIVVCKDVQDV